MRYSDLTYIGHQESSSSIGHQGDMPYCVVGGSTETYRHRTCICSCNSLIQPFPCKIDFSKMFFTHFVLRSIWCNKMDCQFIRRHWSHINTLPSAVLFCFLIPLLNHWGRVTHICVGGLTIIGSDNGLSPGWRQAIIWTSAGIFLIGPLGTNFSEILVGIQTFSFKKMHLKMSSAKWRPFCLGLNVLTYRKCQIFAPMDKSNTFDSKNWYDCCRWDGAYSSQLIIRYNTDLTHCGLMTPCCIRHLGQYWFK